MSAHGHQPQDVVVEGISSLDEPSVSWGWHQHSRKVGLIVGSAFAVFLLLMLFGNHIGRVEDAWLVTVAVLIAVGLVLALRPRSDKTAKRNKVYQVPSDHYSVR